MFAVAWFVADDFVKGAIAAISLYTTSKLFAPAKRRKAK